MAHVPQPSPLHRRRIWRRPLLSRWSLASLMIAALVTAACGEGLVTAAPSPSPHGPSPAVATDAAALGVTADVERPRYLATRERLEIIVVNERAAPVTIEGMRLDDDRFTTVPAIASPARYRPGQRIDLQVAYGDPRCDVDDDAVSSKAAFVLRDETGRATAASLDLPPGGGVLARLHDELCFRERLDRTVDIRFGDDWRRADDGPVITGALRLNRSGGASSTVVIDELAGNVIFGVTVPGVGSRPLLEMPRGERTATLAVEISATRCEPHALAESKKTFRFPIWVGIDGGPAHYAEIEPDGPARAALQTLIDECAAPP